jgi:putative DNA methylase
MTTKPTTSGAARRVIEEQMPLTAISAHSAYEKSIRHGHLSTLHIWWARRPLAACRAAIFAALVPHPDDPLEATRLQTFIASLAKWDNSIDSDSPNGPSGVHHYIKDARAAIRKAFPDRAPRVLDPFSGGGAIPLEALRLGCETYAFDLNPVAHIIQLATLVYPQKYAQRSGSYGEKPGATLVGDVQRWSKWVAERARDEIGDLYPRDASGAAPVAYLWARTITCPRADCAVAVPLIRQT